MLLAPVTPPSEEMSASPMQQLPSTARGIAAFLLEEGIRGYRCSFDDCPLARFFRRFDQEGGAVSPYAYWGEGAEGRALPQAAQEFIDRFDRGEFPELDLLASPGVMRTS